MTQLVVKLDNIFTSPDLIYLQQEDAAWINPQDQDPDIENPPEAFMHFIRNGKFSVHIKTDNLRPVGDESEPNKPQSYLIDGDHFGEIGMMYEGKRTATIRSENYGTLAMLKKSHFNELSKTFDKFNCNFKEAWSNQMFKYQDELSLWLMIEMDKISYFRALTLNTKQEIIYNMERITYEKGSPICKKDVVADKLILIH